MAATSIQWCDHSINPIRARLKATGAVGHYCEKIASGCTRCYSSALQRRFKMPEFGSGQKRDDVEIFLDESKLEEVRKRKKPTRYFWCDMTDLFGNWVKPEWAKACFETMDSTPQHTHLLLTKRPENVLSMWPAIVEKGSVIAFNDRDAKSLGVETGVLTPATISRGNSDRKNVWIGTSVSDQATADKQIPQLALLRDLCPVLFLSVEPLLGPIKLSQPLQCSIANDIDWLIVGGESGHNARPCCVEWIDSIVRQCQGSSVPVFVKQFGSNSMVEETRKPMRLLDSKGGDPEEWPGPLRVRQFPKVSV